jgi:hypothetical protein
MSSFLPATKKIKVFLLFFKKKLANEGFSDEYLLLAGDVYRGRTKLLKWGFYWQ